MPSSSWAKFFSAILASLYVIILPLQFLDTYFYPFFTAIRLFDVKIIFIIFLWASLLYKIIYKKTFLPPILLKLNNKLLFPFTLVLSILFIFITKLTYPTIILQHLKLHPDSFFFLAGTTGLIYFLNPKNNYSEDPNSLSLRLLGPIVILLNLLLYIFSHKTFVTVNSEDHIIEYYQFVLYIGAAVYLFKTYLHLNKQPDILKYFFLFATLAVTFVAMEEISWGQRIIGFGTPEVILINNVQNEFSFHNLKPFQAILHHSYIILGLLGTFAWPISKKYFIKLHHKFKVLIPPPQLSFFFFTLFVFYYLHEHQYFYYDLLSDQRTHYYQWLETGELMLSIGVFFYSKNIFARKNHLPKIASVIRQKAN